MKYIEKAVFTIVFLISIGAYSVISIINEKDTFASFFSELKIENATDVENTIADIDTMVEDNVAARYELIETYGFVTKLLGKNEVNGFEYVRDKNGFLSLGNFWNEIYQLDEKSLALETEEFYEYLQKLGTDMLVVAYPQKVSANWTDGYSGIPYDDYSYETNQFMIQIRRYRIPNIDLGLSFQKLDEDYEDLFFKTDHHWTSYGAFIGFKSIVEEIEKLGYSINPEGKYTDLENYTVVHYEDMMLGSSGRSVGLVYSGGPEDFDLYYYNDDSQYTYTANDSEVINGNIETALLNFSIPVEIEENLENIYELSLYDIYLRGMRSKMSVVNNSKDDGLKVLMITDSYSSPIATWLAPMCSQVDFMWAKQVTAETIKDAVDNNDYDLVILGLYPNDFNSDFIHFNID